MITTTLSPTPRRQRHNTSSPVRGFTLVEVMIAAALSSFILAAVLSTFLFLGRSGANIANYSDMEAQARKALELFAEDTRQASDAVWLSSTSLRLLVNANPVIYTYNAGTFTRTASASTTTLLTGIQEPVPVTNPFFRAYNIQGVEIDLGTAAALTAARTATKQIQISLSAARTTTTVSTATNTVLSARYVLRNKRVTA